MKKTIAFLQNLPLLLIILAMPNCVHKKQIDRQKLHIRTHNTQKNASIRAELPPITIWVHGTLVLRKPLYHRIFEDKTRLVPANSLPKNHHFREIAQTIAEHDPEQFPLEEFYIFSWSGKLQNQERKYAAQMLYREIMQLREVYIKKYECEPIIRIIAHSHGGNVVLNMAKIKNAPIPLSIESLILLACPVQEKTKHLISTPIFKRVYSLYSSLDIIQILAPQFKLACTTHPITAKHRRHYRIPPFSSRLFPTYNHLTQAKIKINGYPISHTRFSRKDFAALLPIILQKLDSWHTESIANNSIRKHKLLLIYKNSTN